MNRPLLPLLIAFATLTACQPAAVPSRIDAPEADMARLLVTAADRSLLAAPVKADIDHLVLTLFRAGTPETQVASLTVSKAELSRTVSFANLRSGATYRIQAAAYRLGGALISDPARSTTTVTLGTDHAQPTLARVPVKLADETFAGAATAGIVVTDGATTGDAPGIAIALGGVVTTAAGSGTAGATDATGTAAAFNTPTGLAADAAGNVYVADKANLAIRKITPGGVVSTFATGFTGPEDVAVAADGTFFVADNDATCIRKVTADGTVSTFASGLGPVNSLAFDAARNLYFTVDGSALIKRISPAGAVSTFVGSGATFTGTTVQGFDDPRGLAFAPSGDLVVVDSQRNRICKVTPAGAVSVLAGSGVPGFADGPAATARFEFPADAAVDGTGTIYIAGDGDHRVRAISPTGTVSTLAGSVASGHLDGKASVARFTYPYGLALDGRGGLYVSDVGTNRIRRIR